MDTNRLNDMLARYGEVCSQKAAGKILNVVPRTISRMMDDGRLRRIGKRVDVRSIYEYIENPHQANFRTRVNGRGVRSSLAEGAFLAAARSGKWSNRG